MFGEGLLGNKVELNLFVFVAKISISIESTDLQIAKFGQLCNIFLILLTL